MTCSGSEGSGLMLSYNAAGTIAGARARLGTARPGPGRPAANPHALRALEAPGSDTKNSGGAGVALAQLKRQG